MVLDSSVGGDLEFRSFTSIPLGATAWHFVVWQAAFSRAQRAGTLRTKIATSVGRRVNADAWP